MDKATQKKKRLLLSWHDGIAVGATLIVLVIILLVTLFGLPKGEVSESVLEIRYRNKIVSSSLKVVDNSNKNVSYALSFRRELKANESYSTSLNDEKKFNETSLTLNQLKKLDFEKDYRKGVDKYIVIKDDLIDGFSSFVGPQIDVLVENGGFKVALENSPKNYCSKQGFENKVNWPIVCLPNSFSVVLSSMYMGGVNGQV